MGPPDPVIGLLTDYGPGGEHVGALHAEVAARAPALRIVDLAHDIPPGDIAQGAVLLARLAARLPRAVHVAVVDPGVGGPRRAAALSLPGGGALVGPDNGLLAPAARALGAVAAVSLPPLGPERPATFHGRDLFVPAAVRLALGEPLAALGEPFPAGDLVPADLPAATVSDGELRARVLGTDRYGNLQLLAGAADLDALGAGPGDRVWVAVGDRRHPATVARTFGDVAPRATLVHIDSHGHVAVAVNGRDAARRIEATPGMWLRIGRW
ncbi:MAG: SAM-dependent chlorinase/fluorinase [Miltoncostaeaceae bacterium]